MNKTKIISVGTILWVLLTVILTFIRDSSPFFVISHPIWVLATIIPMGLLQLYGIKSRTERKSEHFLIFGGMVMAFVTGIGVHMEFLSPLLHQGLTWPLAAFMVWISVQDFFS